MLSDTAAGAGDGPAPPDNPDLVTTELAPGVCRLALKGGGASIIVTRGIDPDGIAPGLAAEDAALIALAAPAPSRGTPRLPVSRLPDASLWPDYIVPH